MNSEIDEEISSFPPVVSLSGDASQTQGAPQESAPLPRIGTKPSSTNGMSTKTKIILGLVLLGSVLVIGLATGLVTSRSGGGGVGEANSDIREANSGDGDGDGGVGDANSGSSTEISNPSVTSDGSKEDNDTVVFQGPKAVSYRVAVESLSEYCTFVSDPVNHFDLTIQAECPYGIVLLSKTNWCKVLANGRQLECASLPVEQESTLDILCYAHDPTLADLALTFSLIGSSTYLCEHAENIETGFTKVRADKICNWHSYTTTGSASHRIQVRSITRPAADLGSGTSTGDCRVEIYCDDCSGCNQESHCSISVPDVHLITSGLKEGHLEDFVLSKATGEPCEYNPSCESNTCIHGQCAEEHLKANEVGCDEDGDCATAACAMTDVESTELEQRICCPTGGSLRNKNDQARSVVCGGQTTGKVCFDNALCESGVCLFGKCAPGRQPALAPCESDDQCFSGACAAMNKTISLTVCCSSGIAERIGGTRYCAGLDDEVPCFDDKQCSKGACGRLFYDIYAPYGCCPSGGHVGTSLGGYTRDFLCTGLDTGVACGDNDRACASGNCALEYGKKTYESECCHGSKTTIRKDYLTRDYCMEVHPGGACSQDNMCTSGVCLYEVCQSAKLKDMEDCDSNADCINGACGLTAYDRDARRVCCKDGIVRAEKIDHLYETFCPDLYKEGVLCGFDDMCLSGKCAQKFNGWVAPEVCCGTNATTTAYYSYNTHRVCANAPAGDRCLSLDMCRSGACGLLYDGQGEPSVIDPKYCCETNATIPWDFIKSYGSKSSYTFCANVPTGANCLSNEFCASGNCTSGSICI